MSEDRTRVYVRVDRSPCPRAVPIKASEQGVLKMNARTQGLKQLVSESQYVVDPVAVSEAIVARLLAGRVLAHTPGPCERGRTG